MTSRTSPYGTVSTNMSEDNYVHYAYYAIGYRSDNNYYYMWNATKGYLRYKFEETVRLSKIAVSLGFYGGIYNRQIELRYLDENNILIPVYSATVTPAELNAWEDFEKKIDTVKANGIEIYVSGQYTGIRRFLAFGRTL